MKRGLIVIAALACVSWSGVHAQQPPAPGPAKIQTLIITGQNGHDWAGTTPLLRKMLEDTGKFEVRVTEEFPRGPDRKRWRRTNSCVLNYFERGRKELRWGEKTDASLPGLGARPAKAVVVYHFSMAAFDGWTEYEKMAGGNWRPNNGHHSARHDFTSTSRTRNIRSRRG